MSLHLRSWFASSRYLLFTLLIWALVILHLRLNATNPPKQWPSSLGLLPNDDNVGIANGVCGEGTQSRRLVVTVKTGATEASVKIPSQLQTFLKCAPHVLIFSDMEADIGSTHLYDALDAIPDSVKEKNSDFDLYRKQKELNDLTKIATLLGDMKDPRRPSDLAAWTLDKYKNLHIVEKAWAMQPDMDWYFHIDADTYVVWSTLMLWLERLDPSEKSFIGSLSYINGKAFAHGGSGMLLSHAATHDFTVTHNGTVARWDDKLHDNCCGDWVLAQALKEFDMDVMNANPTINGDQPHVIPFSSDRWCKPLVTMHHITSDEARLLSDFESRRKDISIPLTYGELFVDFVYGRIPDFEFDWDNDAKDITIDNLTNLEGCQLACEQNKSCLQYRFRGQTCNLGTTHIKLGEKVEVQDGEHWQSGWNRSRIATWSSKRRKCVDFNFPFQT